MTLSSTRSNSKTELIRKIRLLLPDGENNLTKRVVAVRELVAFLENIMRSAATSEVFFYFLEHGAATAWLLQVELQMSEASAYRALKRLRVMDIVVDAISIRHQTGARGGPPPTVWALLGTPPEVVAAAIRKHQRALSPKYRVAEKFVQDILEPQLNRDPSGRGITYNQIIRYSRGQTAPYRNRDIADLAATILTMKGIKVWR